MAFQTTLTPGVLHLAAGAAGIAIYTLYYRKGEHHLYPWRHVQAILALVILTTFGLKELDPTLSTTTAAQRATTLTATFVAALLSSVLIYRQLLNPLNVFPGYPFAKLTGFDHVFRVARNKDMFLKLHESHQKWGKFVRIGPNDVSVSDADVVRVALGPQSKCIKAQWYTLELPAASMHTARSRAEHDRRRRVWSPAFSDKALRGYEQRIKVYNQALIQQLEGLSGKPVDISKWFNFWSFDVMGDLAFGQSFKMLHEAKGHWAVDLLDKQQEGAGFGLPCWAARALMAIPGARKAYYTFLRFCAEQIETRIGLQGKQTNPDITHYLIDDFLTKGLKGSARQAELKQMYLDSKLIIVAGSDTTATTMAFLFYHIAREPGLLTRLREEIEGLTGGGEFDHRKIQSAPLLNGCINETLRLHPPVPSGLYRKAPPEGVYVGEQYIPGDTVMLVNFYAMGRDDSHFVHADQFIPERFSTRPELIKHKDAFAPFSTGPFSCIGKNLALIEIRLLAAHLITKFDVEFAPGEDGSDLLRSHDHFVVALRPLNLILKKR
ncbi:cytochrome P450 [Aspergillus pseudoustus]|uniref:Cytochrome P450 n=1 Tax=Aspergillus pseudoustus TaxID=1810923 RepID=A0ABR4K8G2_9EURO